ncbi:MAG: hypothetical protein HZC02_00975 [Candidatus Levybacteria bacterium]|nr:hypothetical protein [Candidatus Levybacteria bacterium]
MLNELNNIRSLEDIRILYFKYKDAPQFSLALSVLIAVVVIVVVGKFVMPQIDRWFSIQNELKATNDRIDTLQKNISLVNSLSDQVIATDYDLAKKALPYVKDYTSIINTINYLAISSSVSLDDYTFQVGNLSTTSANLSPETAISVKVTIKGTIAQFQTFLQKVNEVLPLAEIVNVSYSNNSGDLGMIFFYKYLPKETQITYTDPLRVIDQDKLQTIEMLKKWDITVKDVAFDQQVASESGN